jgi:hypothetical protein
MCFFGSQGNPVQIRNGRATVSGHEPRDSHCGKPWEGSGSRFSPASQDTLSYDVFAQGTVGPTSTFAVQQL